MVRYRKTAMRSRRKSIFPIIFCIAFIFMAFFGLGTLWFAKTSEVLAADMQQVQPAQEQHSVQEAPVQDESSAASFNAECVILYDVNQNMILFEKNYTQRCEPASLTKLLTVLTACRYQGDTIRYTVGDEIDLIGSNSSIAYLRKGDVLSFEAIVDAVLLSSGNDATYSLAVNLARYHGGERLSDHEALEYFVELMNETANDIGCTDSHFMTVDGYPDVQHYSTAVDLLRIAIAAINNPIMENSMSKSKAYHMFHSGRDVVWENTNKLLWQESEYYYAYATGMKTGSTSNTDYSLAASAEKDGRQIIAIILGAPSNGARFEEAISLFNLSFGL